MEKNQPQNPWARYADDAVVHCRTRIEAENLYHRLGQRFKECGLELHPDKTRIVYCKDDNRSENHAETSFDFLSYTFQARRSKNRYGKYFISYGRFYKSQMYPVYRHMNQVLVLWARRKYKKLKTHKTRADNWLGNIAKREPNLFIHWQMGIKPTAG